MMSKKIRTQQLIEQARKQGQEEGFVNGTATATTNIIVDALRRFPVAVQAQILSNVAQWHGTQENDPEAGGTKSKSQSKILKLH